MVPPVSPHSIGVSAQAAALLPLQLPAGVHRKAADIGSSIGALIPLRETRMEFLVLSFFLIWTCSYLEMETCTCVSLSVSLQDSAPLTSTCPSAQLINLCPVSRHRVTLLDTPGTTQA